jgi:hypothetical protein
MHRRRRLGWRRPLGWQFVAQDAAKDDAAVIVGSYVGTRGSGRELGHNVWGRMPRRMAEKGGDAKGGRRRKGRLRGDRRIHDNVQKQESRLARIGKIRGD